MFSATKMLLAFGAGVLGPLIGGTQVFIIYGFFGILVAVMGSCGMDTTWLSDIPLNTVFLPAIIFNAAGFATAYAAKHYDIRGVETGRSLYFTKDPLVYLCGGVIGVLGYVLFTLVNEGFTALQLVNADAGAVVVVAIGVLGRVLLNQEQKINKENLAWLKSGDVKFWASEILFAGVLSVVIAYFVGMTGLTSIGFSLSAMSLLLALIDPEFPCTHHTTLVAGYAMTATGSLIIAAVFGIIAELIFMAFTKVFNTDCGTHVDGPAVAIAICSIIIAVIF